jgi:DNA-directed RNA polymerase subunit D
MEQVKITPEQLVIRIDSNHTLANAIRRSVEHIQTLAINEVEFFKNDSALYDEFLAHRLGLIPIKTEEKTGQKAEVQFKLKKSGPCMVYSGDLTGGTKVVYDKIPLTLLEKGQELELVATARMGDALFHTKHVPGLCYYRHLIEVKSSPEIDKIVQASHGVIPAEKKGNKWICDLKDSEIDMITRLEKDAVSDGQEILLFVESFGMMDASIILKKSIDVLEKNLDTIDKAL